MTPLIKAMQHFDYHALYALYQSVGWSNYTKDEARFKRMFQTSLQTYGAYQDDRLIGLIRLVGDQEHIIYIQDILVFPTHQRKGIGRALIEHVLSEYSSVRQKVLITDDDSPSALAFYKSLGFKRSNQAGIVCFIKMH